MQRLSNKTRDELYQAISEDITQARLKIEKLNIEDDFISEQLDKILFNLNCSAPQKALDCFIYNKER